MNPEVCRGPGIDGFYHCGHGGYEADGLLRLLLQWGLLEIFGMEVMEEEVCRGAGKQLLKSLDV